MLSRLPILVASCWYLMLAALPLQAQERDLSVGARYLAPDGEVPSTAQTLAEWADAQRVVQRPSLLGGRYVLDTRFTIAPDEGDLWVVHLGNTVVEHLRITLIAADGSIRTRQSGYWAPHRYLLHYGELMRLQPGSYRMLLEFESPYFRSYPQFSLWRETDYLGHVALRTTLAMGCLGTLVSLALFNLFMFVSVRNRSQLHYATYMLAYAAGWAAVFNLPASLGLPAWPLGWNYIPFFLLPIFATQFYLHFLQLDRHQPALARWSRLNFVLPALLLPSCFVAPAYAHSLATGVIAVWLGLALASGIACLRGGYKPARYFVLAFCALIVPACLILPANLGLMPDFVDSELFTLLGGTLDGLLLAFALADRLRLALQQKDLYLQQLDAALRLANTDSLTDMGSRHAFDEFLRNGFDFEAPPSASEPALAIIDVDGLKTVNERHGYTTGDQLLRDFARMLHDRLGGRAQIFRMGGDEFAVTASAADCAQLVTLLPEMEELLANRAGHAFCLHAGISYSHEAATAAILVTLADTRLYLAKSGRRKRQLRLA